MGEHFKLENKDLRLPKVLGEVRPDVKGDTDKNLQGGQAGLGDVPMQGKDKNLTAQHSQPKGNFATPSQTATPRPTTPDQFPAVGLPDAVGHETGDAHTTGTPQPRVSPNSPEMEQAVQAGKQAFKALSELAQGGKKVAQNMLTKVATTQEVFQKAFTANLLGNKPAAPKSTAQFKLPVTPGARTPEEPATKEAVLANAQAEEKSGTKQKDPKTVAAQVAKQAPTPFSTQPPSGEVAKRKDELKKIATNRESAKALAGVASGIRQVVVEAGGGEEYSGGSHEGGFAGQLVHDFKAMVSKAGSALNVLVYGDTQHYPETETLYAKLGLSKVLYGAQELLQRAVPVDERISNNQDDTAFSKRVANADPKDINKMAIDSRRGIYGGIIG